MYERVCDAPEVVTGSGENVARRSSLDVEQMIQVERLAEILRTALPSGWSPSIQGEWSAAQVLLAHGVRVKQEKN